MEQSNNLKIDIDSDIESVYMKAVKGTPEEPMFIRHINDLHTAIKSNINFIFLTDSIRCSDLSVKKEAAIYNSFINDTRLQNIDIHLYYSNNLVDLFILLKDLLTVHPNLRSLEFKTIGYKISPIVPEDFELFCSGLRHARGLKELAIFCSDELTNDKIIQMLTSAIQDNKTITSIKLVAPLSVTSAIATSLKKNTRIKILHIEQPQRSRAPFNIIFIKELFEENTTIKSLLFSHLVYTDADVDPLMSFLETTTTLQALQFPLSNYYYNGINMEQQQHQFNEQIFPRFIKNIMRPNSPLRTLDIPHLVTEDLNMLFRSLANNSTLTDLRVGKIEVNDYFNETDNQRYRSLLSINEDTINAWNELLTKNKALKKIRFNGFVFDDEEEEMSEFDKISVDWFKHNKTLTKLDLKANSAIGILLGDTLAQNKTLKALKCSASLISSQFWQDLLTNTTLTELDFSDLTNNYDFEKETVQFIRHNTTVQKLKSTLWNSELELFFEELANNCTITSYANIFNEYTRDSDYSIESITVLKNNWKLTELDLQTEWYKALYKPILTRNRQFKLSLTLVMHNIVRQKPTMFPMEIWRLIFRHLTPELSILV